MKQLMIIVAALLMAVGYTNAQIVRENEAAVVYYMPKTELVIHIDYEVVTQTPGVFYQYAERYLGAEEIIMENNTNCQLRAVCVATESSADTERAYKVTAQKGINTQLVSLSEDGRLVGYGIENASLQFSERSQGELQNGGRAAYSLEAGSIIHRTILLSGIVESTLAILIEDWENALPTTMHLAYLPKDGIIRLRLSTYGEASNEEIEMQLAALKPLIADYLIATEDLPLEIILGNLLKERQQTIATAESCTGGRLAAALNAQSGSSAYYMGSVVAYDNRIKEQVLGVAHDTLMEWGAVSEQTVREMAEGARALMQTDYAIATSGIAGPTGGTPDKPVGTVWIAWAMPEGTIAKCFHFGVAREREQITQRAVTAALVELIKSLNTKQ